MLFRELTEAGADKPSLVTTMFTSSLEMKGTSWDRFYEVLEQSAKPDTDMLSGADLDKGVRGLLNNLDDLAVDVPKAPAQVGDILGRLVSAGLLDLKSVGGHLAEADQEEVPEGEETMLVSGGGALKVLGSLLKMMLNNMGDADAKAAWSSSGLDVKSFMPAADREDAAVLQTFKDDFELEQLL